MSKKHRKQKWIKFRHKVITFLAYYPMFIYTRLAYGIKIKRYKEKKKRPYIILLNHQTPLDQFFVGLSFKRPIYYMATEDIFSLGFASKLIKYAVAPIPIKKQTTDARAVLNLMRVVSEGGSVCIAPEGNRTYSGKTEHINPTIASLIKKLKLPVAFYKIEGGYGVEPRWSDVKRKGKMVGYVSKVLEPSEYENLSANEIYDLIVKETFVDETKIIGEFKHKKRAEYLERCVYVCPKCGLSEFHSNGAFVTCKKCGLQAEYTVDKEFKGVDCEFPFKTVNDWYEYQKSFINKLDIDKFYDAPAYIDQATVKLVIPYKKKESLYDSAEIKLYGDKIILISNENSLALDFDSVSAISVLGRNKLNVYHGDKIYQVKGDKRFNALKYVNFCFRYKNVKKGDENEQFLGL
jgi:1-acyl-sn-glycerol-3-phosphate acyltransferase